MNMTMTQWLQFLVKMGVSYMTAYKWAGAFATSITESTFPGGQTELSKFMGQILHETGMLETTEENLNYSVEGLVKTFGLKRITQEQANKYGRINGKQDADKRAIANIVYGGEWGLRNLGNSEPEDGWNMRGSGIIQITGRHWFTLLGTKLNMDLIAHPEWVRDPGYKAVAVGIAWWQENITPAMLKDDVALRKEVNGGDLGLAETIALASAATTNIASVMQTVA